MLPNVPRNIRRINELRARMLARPGCQRHRLRAVVSGKRADFRPQEMIMKKSTLLAGISLALMVVAGAA